VDKKLFLFKEKFKFNEFIWFSYIILFVKCESLFPISFDLLLLLLKLDILFDLLWENLFCLNCRNLVFAKLKSGFLFEILIVCARKLSKY